VVATCYGRIVELAAHDGSFGNYALIDCTTKDGEATEWYMLHAHLSERTVDLGATVKPGDVLGLSGATGFVTGAHLHWQMSRNRREFPRDISVMADPFSFPVVSAVEPVVSNGASAAVSIDEYFTGVCRGLGFAPTPWRLAVLKFWGGQESPGQLFTEAWNPLATTRDGELNLAFDNGNGPGHWNSVPVKVYANAAAGICATVETLKLSFYPNIRRCLADQASYPEAVADFATWVGSDEYGRRIVEFMTTTTASRAEGAEPEPAIAAAWTEERIRAIAREEALKVLTPVNGSGVVNPALDRLEALLRAADASTLDRLVDVLEREGLLTG
jgi:hypothetical protein